ncbi:hypothetical protein Barb7_02106 [Bacteroidales bacterium Barb7]|nr:hypothetical protein Barb7_02106 [Bacteroidales bacterium Barb7]
MRLNSATSTRKTRPTTLYCCFRYDIAPSLTYEAILAISSVPSLSRIICLKKNSANPRATTDATGIIQKIEVIIDMNLLLINKNRLREEA